MTAPGGRPDCFRCGEPLARWRLAPARPLDHGIAEILDARGARADPGAPCPDAVPKRGPA